MILLHRLAALYLRLRRKRVPLEEMLSAWAGARWELRCYRKPAGERSAGR